MEEQNQEKPELSKKTEKKEERDNYPSASLYVGDIHPDTTEAFLYEIFKEAGSIVSIRVCRDSFTRESLGYAYVNFGIPQDAERALHTLNYTVINDKPIRIMWAHKDPTLRKTGIGNVLIKGLDAGIDNKCLYDTFSAFGDILSSRVQHSPGTRFGTGYVHFSSVEAAQRSIDKANGKKLNGKIVTVEHYRRERKSEINDTNYTNVYIRNLKKEIDNEKLNEILFLYGTIQNVAVVKNKSGESKGVAFANFETHKAAKNCVDRLNENEEYAQEGKKLLVCRSMKKSERVRYLHEKFTNEGPPLYQNPGTNVYVKHLDETVDDDRLREMFQEFGKIEKCYVMKDEKTGISKGFGFVEFSKPEEATRAINQMSEKRFGNKPIYVALAQPKEVRRQQMLSRFSKYGGRGGGLFGHRGRYHRGGYHRGGRGFYRGTRGGFRGSRYHHRGGFHGPPHPHHPHHHHGPPHHHHGPPHHQHQHQPRRGFMMSQQAQNFNPEEYEKHLKQQQQTQQQQFPGPPMHPPPGPGPMMGGPGPGPPGPTPQGKRSIPSPQTLFRLEMKEQKQILGEHLFPLVYENCQNQDDAGRITGMLLEMDNTDILHLLESPKALEGKISEAKGALEDRNEEPQDGRRKKSTKESEKISAKEIEALKKKLNGLGKKEQKDVFGEKLYPRVKKLCEGIEVPLKNAPGSITAMILEMDNTDLLFQLESPETLREKVFEALELLVTHEERARRHAISMQLQTELQSELFHSKVPSKSRTKKKSSKYVRPKPKTSAQRRPQQFLEGRIDLMFDELNRLKQSQKKYEKEKELMEVEIRKLKIENQKQNERIRTLERKLEVDDVQPTTICISKCELLFYQGQIHPSGEITRLSNQPTYEFTSKNPILVVLKLVNENGVPLKKKHCEHLCLTSKICEEGSATGIRGIVSGGRTLEVDLDKLEFSENGEVLVCTIEERRMEPGNYVYHLYESDFGILKRTFFIRK